MKYKLRTDRRALRETAIALDYYDSVSLIAGKRFLAELNHVYKKIMTNPEFYSYVSDKSTDKFRAAKMRRFPFIVVFQINGAEVYVSSVLDTRRGSEAYIFD